MRKPIAVVIVVLVVASSTVIAFASIPSADGVIRGCFRKSDGRLRVINYEAGRRCLAGERGLKWSVQGPRGPRGLQGIQGPPGPQGPPGESSNVVSQHVVASFEPATDPFSTASWTQPANTLARIYWRVNITAPGDPCQSTEAAVVGTRFWLNDVDAAGDGSVYVVGPGETKTVPAAGSFTFEGGEVLLPGDYELKTETTTETIAPDCLDTIVETEVFVETVA